MHSWNLSTNEIVLLQEKMATQVVIKGMPYPIDTIAGIDLAYHKEKNLGFCAIVVLSFPQLDIIDIYYEYETVDFPYISGFLSFREGPLIEKTFKKVRQKIDLILFDGQGIAHPRKLGIASHMGLLFDIPTIGCAKTKLSGSFKEPDLKKGSKSYLLDKENHKIGVVLRTKDNVNPMYISPGHLIGVDEAADIALQCVSQFKITEPTRLADIEVARYKKEILETINV